MKHRLLLLLAMMALPLAMMAQGSDFGMWYSIGVEKKIDKKWSVGLEGELRTLDNASKTDRWKIGLDGKYKILPWLKASAGYNLLLDKDYTYHDDGSLNKRGHYTRHRFHVGLEGEHEFGGGFTLSLREQWQYTYRPEQTVSERYDYDQGDWDGKSKTYKGKGKSLLRSRLQLKYKIAGTPLRPFANVELYNGWGIKKARYGVGMDWKVNKQNTLSLQYKFQDTHRDDDGDYTFDRHLLGLEYKLKF